MTNKEFYGNKLLAIALEDVCHKMLTAFYDKERCAEKKCEDCKFYNIERIENWLNAEHEELPLLKNGDNLKPGDWIMVRDMVRDCDGEHWVKRQFLFYYNGRFYCQLVDSSIGNGEYVSWEQARLPMEGE